MSRSGYGDDPHPAHFDRIAIGEWIVLVLHTGFLGDVASRPGRLGYPSPIGEMVRMVVRLQDMAYAKIVLLGEPGLLLDLPLGLYDPSLALIGD